MNSGDSRWQEIPLGEITTLITKGTTPTTLGRQFTETGIPFIKVESISEEGIIIKDKLAYINKETHEALKRSQIELDDVLFSIAGAIGRTTLMKSGFGPANTNQALAIIRPRRESVYPKYLYYYLRSAAFQQFSLGRVVQTAQANVSLGVLSVAPVRLPPIEIQRRIGDVLSSYDELIENNTRRIAILEEMAQATYREWFVNFRFPGHERMELVESELGPIPAGWETRNLFDVADVTYGFPFKSKQFTSGPDGMPVIRIRDIPNNQSETYTTEKADEKYIVRNGDLLIGMDGDFHRGKWSGGEAYLNQRVARIRSKGQLSAYHLFLALEGPIKYFNATITGTTVAHLGDKHLRQIILAVPSSDVLAQARRVLQPLFESEMNLRMRTEMLRQTRDLLLPKLISGEIDVEALDLEPVESIA